MKYEFRILPTSLIPLATLEFAKDVPGFDEEIEWIAEILNCKSYERVD